MSTIAAIATPPGNGGIAIIRISGPDAFTALDKLVAPVSQTKRAIDPWRLYRGRIADKNGEPLDDVLAVRMPGPATYTGEDVAEIHCHGGQRIAECVLEAALAAGARQAERGEFTRRAFLNGRIDLSQAEAVAEMIAAPSREALRYDLRRLDGALGCRVRMLAEELDQLRALACIGLDFPDDEVKALEPEDFSQRAGQTLASIRVLLKGAERAQLLQNGAAVVLCGPVNVGKSSLFNALAGSQRALVTDIPGTTRDFLEAVINLEGLAARLIDTAGLREPECGIEALGIERTRAQLENADLALLVVDATADLSRKPDQIKDIPAGKDCVIVINKLDLLPSSPVLPSWIERSPHCCVSAHSGEGLDELSRLIRSALIKETSPGSDYVSPNLRQAEQLRKAAKHLETLLADLALGQSYDCCLGSLDAASQALAETIGLSGHAELLDRIFSQFCIGK